MSQTKEVSGATLKTPKKATGDNSIVSSVLEKVRFIADKYVTPTTYNRARALQALTEVSVDKVEKISIDLMHYNKLMSEKAKDVCFDMTISISQENRSVITVLIGRSQEIYGVRQNPIYRPLYNLHITNEYVNVVEETKTCSMEDL